MSRTFKVNDGLISPHLDPSDDPPSSPTVYSLEDGRRHPFPVWTFLRRNPSPMVLKIKGEEGPSLPRS